MSRLSRALLLAPLTASLLAPAAPAPAAPAPPPPGGPPTAVIVLLRDQHPELSARSALARRRTATQSEQAPLVDQVEAAGATGIRRFSLINGFAATMPPAQIDRLRADPSVAAVVPDRPTALHPRRDRDGYGYPTRKPAGVTGTDKVIPGTCPSDPGRPLLEPEALQTTHTEYPDPVQPQAHQLATGKGVTVAWIADGLDPHNPDFIRPDGSPVFADYQDFSGTDPTLAGGGAEAFGDASGIAAQGRRPYDLADFVNAAHPLPAGCTIRVRGIAPDASLVGINVFGSADFVVDSLLVQAIDYAVTVDGVDVINESFGGNAYPTDGVDPVALADEAAVAAGVTVVASSGDAGPFNTVGSPAVDPAVVSVGAVTNYRTMAQTGYAGARTFATSWANENASALSSGGTTARGRVPDLVAPGEDGWAVCTPDPVRFASCTNFRNAPSPIENFGGTSQAAPFVAGGAALVIQAYRDSHHGAHPDPALVKQILTSSATDLGLPATQQGAGELDTFRAVRLAQSIKGGAPARGDGLLLRTATGDTQLTATGTADTAEDLPLTVTNDGATTQVLTAHGRVPGTPSVAAQGTIPLDVTAPTTPSFPDGISTDGVPVLRRYATTTFPVAVGADHLTGQLSWPGGGANGQSAVRVALIGPHGEYESHSLPQGSGNHGRVDVRYPAPGTWTAIFFATASPTGFHGDVQYRFSTSRYTDFGTVEPATLTLSPGQTGTFHVRVRLAGDAGDVSAAVEVDNAFHGRSSVPLTLRTLVSGAGTFHGAITGGNGRSAVGEQTGTYLFDVPAGRTDLGVDLTLAGDPNQPLYAALLSPDHQVLSLATNNGTRTLQGYVRNPAPGRWLLFLDVNNPVAGTALADRFTGHLRYDTVDVHATGLPSGRVPAGRPITVRVAVRNTGAAPASFFVDPRRTALVDYDLVTQLGTSADAGIPFEVTSLGPTWLVPAETARLTVEQSATVPADFDLGTLVNGVPEVYGQPHGLTATATVTAQRVSPGLWSATPTALGPTNGPVTGTATYHAVVRAKAFDDAVRSSTGDAWRFAVGAGPASTPYSPLVLQPGEAGTITVTVTPRGPAGGTVDGVLYVDTFSDAVDTGDELAAIPYRYTVG